MMDTSAQSIEKVKTLLTQSDLPKDVLEKLQEELSRVEAMSKTTQFGVEVDRHLNYIDFVTRLPWHKSCHDILDLKRAIQILDKNHHGLEKIKSRILEYISVLILNSQKGKVAHQPILAFVGLVGSGKTSIAYSIAESLGRPIVRIPFGGLGSALQLRGESRLKAEAEPGLILKALKNAQVNNPVILLDELDRVTTEARADIMGVLVELLDPTQNKYFLDHFVGLPFDLSQVMFIATANNLGNVSTAVLDRLEIMEMPFYSDEQKITIGRDYLLPTALEGAGLDSKTVIIGQDAWPTIVRPLGFDGGIRSLKRNIDLMVGKIARMVVEGNAGPFNITTENLGQFLQT